MKELRRICFASMDRSPGRPPELEENTKTGRHGRYSFSPQPDDGIHNCVTWAFAVLNQSTGRKLPMVRDGRMKLAIEALRDLGAEPGQMKKQISKFRIEPYGLFIDLADGNGRIGVDRETGHILLDEGEGADRYHGAVIEPEEFDGMDLRLSAGGAEATVTLRFGGGCVSCAWDHERPGHWALLDRGGLESSQSAQSVCAGRIEWRNRGERGRSFRLAKRSQSGGRVNDDAWKTVPTVRRASSSG